MSQINTSIEVVEVGKKIVQKFEETLNNTSDNLNKIYEEAGQSGWDDKQYKNLGQVIQECDKSLLKPIDKLNDLQDKLQKLQEAIQKYSE